MENLETQLEQALLNVKGLTETNKDLKQKAENLEKYFNEFKENAITKADFEKELADLQLAQKEAVEKMTPKKVKSFNQILKETIEENADTIKSHKPNSGIVDLEMKAVGDMSIATNFTGASVLYQEALPLVTNPFERQWLSDILPKGSSQATQLVYPKENGGEGGIDVWSGTGNKAQVDYDFTTATIPFTWIAGWVTVGREMLDDIAWLTSYLQSRLLIDLKTRENKFILNDATGLIANATAYDGTLTGKVDRVIDAAYGQLVEGTFDAYNPSHVIMRPRDTVGIGLNKASGSGEFDLPVNSMAFGNGKLAIGGLNTVATTSITANNFLAIDAKATQFVTRLAPELRMFEDATLAKQNKIMFRIEERAALAIFNNKALVAGTLTAA